jgi:YHS domain-containing protein
LSGLARRDLLALMSCALAVGASASTTLADEVRLAIKGYDPVSYFEQGKATPGLVAYEHVWDEHRYRFSRPEHRDLFKANPTRYLPQFTNYCTMALARGLLKEANPEYWLINEGRLFLFSMPEGPSRFRSSPAENIDKAEANRVLLPATSR